MAILNKYTDATKASVIEMYLRLLSQKPRDTVWAIANVIHVGMLEEANTRIPSSTIRHWIYEYRKKYGSASEYVEESAEVSNEVALGDSGDYSKVSEMSVVLSKLTAEELAYLLRNDDERLRGVISELGYDNIATKISSLNAMLSTIQAMLAEVAKESRIMQDILSLETSRANNFTEVLGKLVAINEQRV